MPGFPASCLMRNAHAAFPLVFGLPARIGEAIPRPPLQGVSEAG